MPRSPFPYNDVADLEEAVGAASYVKGLQHSQQHSVIETLWYSTDKILEGMVHGNSGEFYAATAFFASYFDGLEFDHGECTCPVSFNCKHVVALVLTAMTPPERSPMPPPPALPPAWERSLRSLLPAGPGDHDWHTAANPLAIELSIAGHSGMPRTSTSQLPILVFARPMKKGKTGWINGGLSWSGLTSMHASGQHPAEHIRLLREIYAVYQSANTGPLYYHDVKSLDLNTFGSSRLWPLLDEAARVGIALVHEQSALGPIANYGTAEFCLDFTCTATGELVIVPAVRIDGVAVDPSTVGFIGTSAHGVVNTDGARIRLAKLTAAVPPRLQQMALDGQVLQVPLREQTVFMTEYYPSLRRSATVISNDGTFTPPDVSDPKLAMLATYDDCHNLTVDWEWAYSIGEHELRAPLDPRGAGNSFRDVERERQLLAELDISFDQSKILSPRTELSGIDTMRFTTEVLPMLDGLDTVYVAIEGTPADYREAGDSLRIGFSTTARMVDQDWFDLGLSITVEGQEVPFKDLFTALNNDIPHMLLPDGAYFSLQKPELQSLKRLIEEARSLQDRPEGPLRISRFQAGLWDELVALGVVDQQADAWQEQVDGLLTLGSVESAQPPVGLAAQLRPYQLDGFRWLAFLWDHQLGGILADDMGLGKTVQSLALICHARQANPGGAPFLILAPTSVVPNWAAECARFAPGLNVVSIGQSATRRGRALDDVVADADVVVTSYTRFRLDIDAYAELPWSALILDEAQFVKNHQSKAYQCVRRLQTPFKLAITGTPMENNLMELWSLLSITAPGLFPSAKNFSEYYRRPIEKEGDTGLLAQLRRRIKPLVLRRTKDQVAGDLPPKQEQVLELALHPKHQKIYQTHLQRERQKILGLIDDMDKNRFTIFRSLTLLRQLSLDASLVDDEYEGIPSAKLDAIADQLHDVIDGGHRALIFSQFTGFLAKVRERLEAEGVQYCYLDGSKRDRAAGLEQFKGGTVPVFLISLKAGGFGLNLTEADYVFLLDPWWNPATEAQAVDRTHRIGQTRNVMVYRLIAKDTIEEKVMALKAKKAKLFSSVMDADSMLSSSLTPEDIRGLFD